MTRPASFNKIWGYEALQITDENNEKTQEFMRSGWEGGSDKKAPSASVQNYHMQKTDQALQEVERQGYLSWRSDVPYSKGARVFFHGNTFYALKDNQDIEPQGSRDNSVWYLIPVQVYPTRYESVEGLGTAAKHSAEDFDPKGSAKAIDQSLSSIAKTGKLNDGVDILDMKRGGTGRSDGNISASNVYTAHLESNCDLVLKNGSGDRLSLEHGEVLSIHNADDVEKFRVQDGRIILGGGYVPTIYRYSGATVMQADSADKLSVERGAVISAHRADDKEHFRVEDGAITLSGGYQPNIFLTDYGLVIKHVSGDSFSIEKEDSMVKKNANGDITFKVIGDQITVGKIPLGQVIGAGDAASKSVVDQTDPSQIGWGAERLVSAGTASGIYLYAKAIKDSLGDSAFWGVFASTNPDELDGQDGALSSASALKGLRDRLRTGYLVGTYAVARRTSGDKVKYGQTTDGSNLVTSSSTGDDGNPTRLGGTWYCLGESPDNRGVTLYVRIL